MVRDREGGFVSRLGRSRNGEGEMFVVNFNQNVAGRRAFFPVQPNAIGKAGEGIGEDIRNESERNGVRLQGR